MLRCLKFICIILCLCMLLIGTVGCTVHPPVVSTPVASALPSDRYTAKFENNWCYRHLNSRLQQCYGTLYTALTDQFETDESVTIQTEDGDSAEHNGIKITLPVTLTSKEEAQTLYNAFFYDNPHLFYVSNYYALEGYSSGDTPLYTQINLVYTMDRDQRSTAVKALEDRVAEILADITPGDDQFTTELYLHDSLATACGYDTAAAAAGYALFPHSYTAYGALVSGNAVCEGYSRAMQLLLKRVGMECTLVTGHSVYNGESHMWNMVTVNGKNYHLDVTWDDSEDRLRHNYFNLDTQHLSLSHHVDEDQLGIDTCQNTEDNYFVKNGTYIDTYERQTIAAAIAQQVLSGADYVELAFASDKFDNALLFLKNATLTKQMVNAHLADSDVVLWDYILRGETAEHILTLYRK